MAPRPRRPAARVPEYGVAPPARIAISIALQVVALAFVYHKLRETGVEAALHTFWRAHSPFVAPCGLLEDKQYVLMSDRVVAPYGVGPGLVHVRGGKLATVQVGPPTADRHQLAFHFLKANPKLRVMDYGDAVIAPGLIDLHIHMNEPGREEWEGIETGTRAAAAGGVTTLVDMPLNSHPCTTTPAELKSKAAAARNKTSVDVGFWAGLVPANAHKPKALRDLVRSGALGFKAFMSPSGINDFPNVSPEDVAAALPAIKALGVPLLVHAELVDDDLPQGGHPSKHATWLASRPRRFERNAIRALLEVLRKDSSPAKPGFRLHIVHLADADALPDLAAAKEEGLPVSVETCPHYLVFEAEGIKDGDTRLKCAPPIREAENRVRLLAAVAAGTVDSLASDHSPCEPSLKLLGQNDFMGAWGGVSGVQYVLPASWHVLSSREQLPEHTSASHADLLRLAQVWSAHPAKVAGLAERKGSLATMKDADIVVWSPEQLADTSVATVQQRHKGTSPYVDMSLRGRVLATFVQGHQVFDAERGVSPQACGNTLLK